MPVNIYRESILQLICAAATDLPNDVSSALAQAKKQEQQHSLGHLALALIAENIHVSRQSRCSLCQDTGLPSFYVQCPVGVNQLALRDELCASLSAATEQGLLRPNCCQTVSRQDATFDPCFSYPLVHFQQWEKDYLSITLLLKGGGCENKGAQYSLPCTLPELGLAERTLAGVKKCVLHAIWEAQGQGCSPGIVGVAIGSDRASGYHYAKEQLLRSLDDHNANPTLAQLEADLVVAANSLKIGAMGWGGTSTLLGCKIAALDRIPACYFVSIAYNCWALRRQTINLEPNTGKILSASYASSSPVSGSPTGTGSFFDKAIKLSTPLSESAVRALHVGDLVLLSGPVFTARDTLHQRLVNSPAPIDLEGQAIFHCGPIMTKAGDSWRAIAIGPTTSLRQEPYTAKLIENHGIRAIIGKGGMGAQTQNALHRCCAVYFHAIGGVAQVYKNCIARVNSVHYLDELGVPEAMWGLELENLPLVVTMDSHGQSLHTQIREDSLQQLGELNNGQHRYA